MEVETSYILPGNMQELPSRVWAQIPWLLSWELRGRIWCVLHYCGGSGTGHHVMINVIKWSRFIANSKLYLYCVLLFTPEANTWLVKSFCACVLSFHLILVSVSSSWVSLQFSCLPLHPELSAAERVLLSCSSRAFWPYSVSTKTGLCIYILCPARNPQHSVIHLVVNYTES